MTELRGFNFVATLALEFNEIESDDETKYSTFYSPLKAEIVVNDSDIDEGFESIYITVISNNKKFLAKDFGWMVDSVVDHSINISK